MSLSPPDNGTSPLKAWLRALEMTAPISRNRLQTSPTLMQDLAEKYGTAPAFLGERECLTYQGLAERCNQYARWAQRQGLAKGDVVCLIMPNCPEYMTIWLGITRVGGIVALVNTNLTGDPLAHSINIVAPTHIIVAAELVDTLAVVMVKLSGGVQCWAHGPGNHGLPRIDREITRIAGDRLQSSECQPPSIMDRALYIYTSGTSGLPKAANVSHFRLMQWSHWFAGMMDTRPSDRMYNCLPMYHSIGGVVATGATLISGGSVLLRRRFSASRFWEDVTKWDCTLFQYIGELCRYLVNSPPDARESRHRIRLCCGNGLRRDIWEEFQRRFRIPQILEFYAATEGNFSLYNGDGKPGAIGRIPSFIAHRSPVALIKLDLDTGVPVRNQEGFCIRCSVNDAGEAIGRILNDCAHPASRFEGYTDEEASESKILRNVFADVDTWFRTGDLMRRDQSGYFYFVDRIGDTFRWKGENVSTMEVADTLCACPGIAEAVVYGVVIPGTEGRAGMTAIVPDQNFDLLTFRQHLTERLPEYARPLFLRIRSAIEMTGTFKPKKQDLSSEGFNPVLTTDPIYFDDRSRNAFVRLDAPLYERIRSGKLRV
jgi:fatty-acyl-CoA synthase